MKKFDFFEDMALVLESWTMEAIQAITDENADLIWTDDEKSFLELQKVISNAGVDKTIVQQVFSECFRGLAVSFLTILDGGTTLAESGRIYLVDEKGAKLGEGLHDDFVGYLMKTGRLK